MKASLEQEKANSLTRSFKNESATTIIANQQPETPTEPTWTRTWRFWGVFVALCLLSFISALDVSIVATALPTITKAVGGEDQYIWIANSFILASSVPQPLFGQFSNIFGRRNPMLVAVVLFALGSGIAGGAHNAAMLIAGRAIQGVGAGGIYVLIDIICCDLVPLRERGQYLGFMFSFAGIGATIGPVVGGALALANWRWIFYMNIPICGVALGVIVVFLRVNYTRSPTWMHALGRVDLLGSAIFVTSMTAILLGLIMGGVKYAWGSWRVILPLVLGVLGWVAFHFYEASNLCKEPIVPPRLFLHRTSATALLLAFVSSILVQIITFFLPVYFQAVLGTSALVSGVDFLPFAVVSMPFAIIGGALMSKIGLYRPLHWASFAFSAIGFGLFSLMNGQTNKAEWAGFQIIASVGSGVAFTTILPAIMAALPESDTASASSAYSFSRSFGQIWGVTLASIIFNGVFDKHLHSITDQVVCSQLANGGAYAYASKQLVRRLPDAIRDQVIDVYTLSLRTVWYVCVGLACFGFLCVFVERDIKLRAQLETEFGLHEGQTSRENQAEAQKVP